MTHDDLIGARIEFRYADETYRIEPLSADRLRRTRIAGEPTGVSDTESYVFSALADGLVLLTWVEADGLGLSNVLNLHTGDLTTHANMGREVFVNRGRFEILS